MLFHETWDRLLPTLKTKEWGKRSRLGEVTASFQNVLCESVVCFAKPISVTDEGNRYEVHTVGPYCNNESMPDLLLKTHFELEVFKMKEWLRKCVYSLKPFYLGIKTTSVTQYSLSQRLTQRPATYTQTRFLSPTALKTLLRQRTAKATRSNFSFNE